MTHRCIAVVLAAAAIAFAGCARHDSRVAPAPAPTPSPTPAVANPLNGAMTPPQNIRHRVAAIMIDNFPDARPQSGLHDADVVYEVEAEGGITRYLALFLSTPAAQVGPVRSARTYFVDLARPYDPFFVHAGQNDDVIDALKDLRAGGFPDLDEIQQTPDAFWRDNSRDMPHNLYTGVPRIRSVGPKSGYPDRPYAGQQFQFDAIGAAAQPTAVPETVASFWLDYAVHFVWDGRAYERFIDGQAQHDRDDDRPYEISDIIAVWVPATVKDKLGDLDMTVYGTFPAVVIVDGRVTKAQWIAVGPTTLPTIVGDDGSALTLKPGQIYIEILPQGSTLKSGKLVFSH